MMMLRIPAFLILAILGYTHLSAQPRKKDRQPNIIFILADDLGYGNVSAFNKRSPIKTPNIDRLAKEGIVFTNFYAGSAVCAPSRASLMTGKTMGHAYIRGNAAVPLRPQDTTVAQLLQAKGYVTGMYGKWSLGENNQTGAAHLKGFNDFFGYTNQTHAHKYYTDKLDEIINGVTVAVDVDTSQYTPDLILNKALGFIDKYHKKPFFLYLPTTLPHAELRVPEKALKKFQNPDGSSKFPVEKPFNPKGGDLHSQAQPHAAFAAMVTRVDHDVARILAAIKKYGLDNNTYVFFTSDNGAHNEGGADPGYFNSSGPFRGIKRDLYEGGIHVPLIVRPPGKIAAKKVNSTQWAFWDILPTFTALAGANSLKDIDGISFAPMLKGQPQKQHDYLYWQFNEGGYKEAIIKGDWKLIRFKKQGTPEILELYNLKTDITEKNNVASANTSITNKLKELMLQAKSPAENKTFDWSAVEK